jgi:hypothetical protein
MPPTPVSAIVERLSQTSYSEKRSHKRYAIALDCQYKLLRENPAARFESGRTLNISSGGILFQCKNPLPVHDSIELAMKWPALLEGVRPLKLVVRGHVVRSDTQGTAVRATHYEFRTAGIRSSIANA